MKAGTHQEFEGLFSLYMAIGIGVAVLVFAAVGFALVHYRARGDRRPSRVSEMNRIEIGVATLILLIVAFLVTRTFTVEARVDSAPKEPTTIDVTAFQWGWRFVYPGQGVEVIGNSNDEPTFAVPGDEPVHFKLTSADVLHSFWIPGERFKRAAIPGRTNEFDLDFETEGTEEGLCTEFCGLRHSDMRFNVWILSKASYRRWLAAHR
jgi:cytochrome c oxidase subunit 2